MKQDRSKGKGRGKQAVVKAKELGSSITGKEEAEAEGKAQQGEGKVQETWGKVKEKVEETVEKIGKGD